MAIHYENYKRFSKRQGFVGPACRPQSAQAVSARWFAVDCRDCKNALMGKRVISRVGQVGNVTMVEADYVMIDILARVEYRDLDADWALMPPISEIFGEVEK
jgi:hypothetical protein